MKLILSTLPREGGFKSWLTPSALAPKEVKYLPLGLLSLKTNAVFSFIENQSEIKILDPFSHNWSIDETVKRINDENPDAVGFSVTTRYCYSLYAMLPRIQARWKIAGGPHCTCHADDLIRWGVHTVFIGQLAELDLVEWLNAPRSGVVNCKTDILQTVFPHRHLIDYENYFFEGKGLIETNRRMSMFSSVGCPNSCVFCSVQSHKAQYRQADAVVDEMEHLLDCGAQSVHVMDDNFNVNTRRVMCVLDAMERRGWSKEWSMRGQVRCDLSLVPRMRALGLRRVHVGIETFDDMALRWMHKSHREKDIERFCKVMNDNGVEILAYLIAGLPNGFQSDPRMYVEKCRALGISKPFINVLFPEPDTEYYWNLVRTKQTHDYWADYFIKPIADFDVPHPAGNGYRDYIIDLVDEAMGVGNGN